MQQIGRPLCAVRFVTSTLTVLLAARCIEHFNLHHARRGVVWTVE